MSGTDEHTIGTPEDQAKNESIPDTLADDLEKTQLESVDDEEQHDPDTTAATADSTSATSATSATSSPRPFIMYTRKELLHLSSSPLVQMPDKMPAFKVWFGEFEQPSTSSKKEADPLTANGVDRSRRYRRDAEDGETTSRPSFRSVLSQPSQMGNFKHQPLRGTDRERDKETERSLRTLSEKFDREKGRVDHLGLPTHSTILRNRDRESAPHLAATRSSGRKREGETSDDWRRVPESGRRGRDDNNTRERDERERPRSRGRDSSQSRTSPSSRRDDKERKTNERDRDRFLESDDDHWRPVGRTARRRDKFPERENGRSQDMDKEPTAPERDSREAWGLADDKDARGQRRGGRDRRPDESKEEKEPAWMENYTPSPSAPLNFLGGKGADGEVDSIQAWKKDMKERELRAKGLLPETAAVAEAPAEVAPPAPSSGGLDEIQQFKLMMRQEEAKRSGALPPSSNTSGAPQSIEGRSISGSTNATSNRSDTPISSLVDAPGPSSERTITTAVSKPEHISQSPSQLTSQAPPLSTTDPSLSSRNKATFDSLHAVPKSAQADATGSRLFPRPNDSANSSAGPQPPVNRETLTPSTSFDPPRQSRLLAFGAQSTKSITQPGLQGSAGSPVSLASVSFSHSNAGQGSVSPESTIVPRHTLDPMWTTRQPSGSPGLTPTFRHPQGGMESEHRVSGHLDMSGIMTNADILARLSGRDDAPQSSNYSYAQSEHALRSGIPLDTNFRGDNTGGYMNHRGVNVDPRVAASLGVSVNNRARGFVSPTDTLQQISDIRGRNGTPPASALGQSNLPYDGQLSAPHSLGKGSRMSKHFREQQQMNGIARSQGTSMNPTMSLPGREHSGINAPIGGGADGRNNIDDLLTMLNNSAENQRHTMGNITTQGQSLHGLQQHQHPHHQHDLQSGSMLGSRYDDPDDRFTANNLVPGLRPSALARNRESVGNLFSGQMDDGMQLSGRVQHQHQQQQQQQLRALNDQLSPFNNQGNLGRMGGGNYQQGIVRGGPSPIRDYNPHGLPQQRLPPGLANLGGRPPHEPSQYIGGGGSFNMQSQSVQGGFQQQPNSFNHLQNLGLGPGAGQPQMRGPPGLQQVSTSIGGSVNGMDFRGGPSLIQQHQNQLLGLGGSAGLAMRGNNLPSQNQIHSSMGLRQQQQQQQQQYPPHVVQQVLNSQMANVGHSGAQLEQRDLIALLMRGTHE